MKDFILIETGSNKYVSINFESGFTSDIEKATRFPADYNFVVEFKSDHRYNWLRTLVKGE